MPGIMTASLFVRGTCGLLLAAGMFAAAAEPALALMPPYVYETARREAASVIIIAVERVEVPSKGFGDCTVNGTVRAVERGSFYAPGQRVILAVPCATATARPPIGGIIWQPAATLEKAPFGRAYLDKAGALVMSQYEQLPSLPGPSADRQ